LPEISIQEQGLITRAIAEIAAAVVSGEPLDPNSPAIAYCVNFSGREAKGQIGREYIDEVLWLSRQGCSCRAKPERGPRGFTVTHLPTCDIIRRPERERAEREAKAARYQELRQRGGNWQPVSRGAL